MRSGKPKYLMLFFWAALMFVTMPALTYAESEYLVENQEVILAEQAQPTGETAGIVPIEESTPPTVSIVPVEPVASPTNDPESLATAEQVIQPAVGMPNTIPTEPTMETVGEEMNRYTVIYGNGCPLIVTDGEKQTPEDTATVVFWDNGEQPGVIDAGDTLIYNGPGGGVCFGGAKEGTLEANTGITVFGGYLSAVYGGGAKDSVLNGTANIDVKASRACTAFYGGGQQDMINGDVDLLLGKTLVEENVPSQEERQIQTQPVFGVDENSMVKGMVNITVTDGERSVVCGSAAQSTTNHINITQTGGKVEALQGTQGVANGDLIFNFRGGTTDIVTGGEAAGARILNVSGSPTIGTQEHFIALEELTDNVVRITGALTGAEKSIRVGFKNVSPVGKTVALGAQEKADAQKFDVNGLDAVQENAELAVKDGNINVTNYYNINLGTDEVVKAYPFDPPTVEIPTAESGKEFLGYFSEAENKKYYNADGSPAPAAYTITADVKLVPRYKDKAAANGSVSNLPDSILPDNAMPTLPKIDIAEQPAVAQASYKVDIGWGEMKFVYKRNAQMWDAQTHSYIDDQSGQWEGYTEGNNRITVKNHSNRNISAGFTLSELPEGLSTAWYADEARTSLADILTLPLCPEGAVEEMIPAGACYLGISGFPSTLKMNEDFKRVGLITVSILPETEANGKLLSSF